MSVDMELIEWKIKRVEHIRKNAAEAALSYLQAKVQLNWRFSHVRSQSIASCKVWYQNRMNIVNTTPTLSQFS
ncbi:hypothetical protein CGI34_17720 [Vibrio parahaemolyticus]|nr:hypothetical protein CGI34_17720 [Vibrio parahaemolyticus]